MRNVAGAWRRRRRLVRMVRRAGRRWAARTTSHAYASACSSRTSMVRECRPPAREPTRFWLARRSTMATSTLANANSAASISPVGPPPAITTACSVTASLRPASRSTLPTRSGGSTSDGGRDHCQQQVKARRKAGGGVEHEHQGASYHPRPLGFGRGVVHRYPVVSAGRPASWTSTR